MKMNPNDPKLTAYALGELDPDEGKAIEAELEEADECRHEIDEIARIAALLNAELAAEPLPGLSYAQQLAIEARLQTNSGKTAARKIYLVTALTGANPIRRIAIIAAALAMVFVVLMAASWFATPTSKGQRQVSSPISTTSKRTESDASETSDAAFARWAAPYKRLQIPLVSVEEAASYTPPEILPIRPSPSM